MNTADQSDQPSSTYAERARQFLAANASPRAVESRPVEWGRGDDHIGRRSTDSWTEATLQAAAAWRAKVFDAGFAWPSGPVEYGGGGLDPTCEATYRALESDFDVPDQSPFTVAWDMVGPAIDAHGTNELKQLLLRPIYRGELLCCQLLSEPEAGSDLAGLRTTAVRDREDWVVNGQKVWTSIAHHARVGQLLARTEPDAPKHQGLTMFVVPMDTPGIQVRPLRQMTGEAEFNEVFLTDVRISDRYRVGARGDGWRAVMTTLMSERASVGAGTGQTTDPATMVRELARHLDRVADPVVRQRLAEIATHDVLLHTVARRAEAARASSAATRGSEGSILKLLGSAQATRVAALATQLLGAAATADTGEWGTYSWSTYLLSTPSYRIAGGTDEIQRNILAERMLGLPRG